MSCFSIAPKPFIRMSDFSYIGSELELFAAVRNWKAYWSDRIRPYIRGDVVEVGAGIGSNTAVMHPGGDVRWVCLEPDSRLTARIPEHIAALRQCEIVCGTLAELEPARRFDTVIYIDVLEHIEDDRGELRLAASRLRPGGHIVVLSPAHQQLYTPFDEAIGHYRRYNRGMLGAISPPGCRLERMEYLDSVGLLLSAANRLFLKQSMPTARQLQFWDRWVIPVSRLLDPCLLRRAGKSILAIWAGR
jgi:SAM-dependent methyltransferase